MTLRELLSDMNSLVAEYGETALDKEVYTEYDYGDYIHTRALDRTTGIDIVKVGDTAYSATGLCVSDHGEDRKVVISSYF